MEEQILQNFQQSSLAHILAISGLHVSYIIMGLSFFITRIKVPKRYGYVLIIMFLLFFLILTNFSISVSRACIMASMVIISKLLHRKPDIFNIFTISFLISILNNPFFIYSVGFKLSYFGTFGVVFLTPIITKAFLKIKISVKIAKIISVPIAAQLAIIPIIIVSFNTVSFTFLISNLLVIPILGIIIIGGFFVAFISFIWMAFSKRIAIILNLFLKLLIFLSNICSKLKLSNFYVVTPNTITIIIYYCVLASIIYIFHLKNNKSLRKNEIKVLEKCSFKNIKKILVTLIIIVIIIEIPYARYNRKLKIYFIDVGQRR